VSVSTCCCLPGRRYGGCKVVCVQFFVFLALRTKCRLRGSQEWRPGGQSTLPANVLDESESKRSYQGKHKTGRIKLKLFIKVNRGVPKKTD
jgi:hypothetical protein